MTPPRLLTKQQAADYCGVTVATFDAYRRRGIVPPPVANTRRWDRRAIDARLDKLSGLNTKSSALDDWLAERQRHAHGRTETH